MNLGSVDHISQYFYRANYHSVHEVKEKSLHKIVFQGSRMSSEPFDDENGNYWHENSVFNNRNYTKQMFALIDEQGNRFEFKTPRYNEKSGNTMESLFAFEYPESLKENTMHQVEMSYVVENKILVTMSIGKYNNYYGSNFESDYFGKPVFIILD